MRARAIQFVCALKKQMQLGFNQYVSHRRISYALRLIEEGHDSVRDIAAACGFSDALYFSKVFKKKSASPQARRSAGKRDFVFICFAQTKGKSF